MLIYTMYSIYRGIRDNRLPKEDEETSWSWHMMEFVEQLIRISQPTQTQGENTKTL